MSAEGNDLNRIQSFPTEERQKMAQQEERELVNLGRLEKGGEVYERALIAETLSSFGNTASLKSINGAVFLEQEHYAVIRTGEGKVRVFAEIQHDADVYNPKKTPRGQSFSITEGENQEKNNQKNPLSTGFKASAFVELKLNTEQQQKLDVQLTRLQGSDPSETVKRLQKGNKTALNAKDEMLKILPSVNAAHVKRDDAGVANVQLVFPPNSFANEGDLNTLNVLDRGNLTRQSLHVMPFIERTEETVSQLGLGEHRYEVTGYSIGRANAMRAEQLLDHQCVDGIPIQQTQGIYIETVGGTDNQLTNLISMIAKQRGGKPLTEQELASIQKEYYAGNTGITLTTKSGQKISMRSFWTAQDPYVSSPPVPDQKDLHHVLFPEYGPGLGQKIFPSSPSVKPHYTENMANLTRDQGGLFHSGPESEAEHIPSVEERRDPTRYGNERGPLDMPIPHEDKIRNIGLRGITAALSGAETLWQRVPEEKLDPNGARIGLLEQMQGCRHLTPEAMEAARAAQLGATGVGNPQPASPTQQPDPGNTHQTPETGPDGRTPK